MWTEGGLKGGPGTSWLRIIFSDKVGDAELGGPTALSSTVTVTRSHAQMMAA